RYFKLSAARFVRSLTAGDKPQTSSRIGADEMMCSASIARRSPCAFLYSTVHAPETSSYEQPVTLQPISSLPPSAFIFSAHASHIMPGPRRGYRNELISVLMTLLRSPLYRCGTSAFLIALPRESPLIRCAAQSAEISLQLMPQTFAV